MIFAFFGHPGAGKSTLVQRFAERQGVPGIDTDRFMTEEERTAVVEGRYTQAMRRANIERYCAYLRATVPPGGHAALADGLPNNAARRFLLAQFPPGAARLVLVETERGLWERRLAERTGNLVPVGVAEAVAYIRSTWEPVAPDIDHELIQNVEDDRAVNARLDQIVTPARPRA